MKNLSVREYFTRWIEGGVMTQSSCNGYRCKQTNYPQDVCHVTEKGLVPVVGWSEDRKHIVYNEVYLRDWDRDILQSICRSKKLLCNSTTMGPELAGIMTLGEVNEAFPY